MEKNVKYLKCGMSWETARCNKYTSLLRILSILL